MLNVLADRTSPEPALGVKSQIRLEVKTLKSNNKHSICVIIVTNIFQQYNYSSLPKETVPAHS